QPDGGGLPGDGGQWRNPGPGRLGVHGAGERGAGGNAERDGHDEEPGDRGRDGVDVDAVVPVDDAILDDSLGLPGEPERGPPDGGGDEDGGRGGAGPGGDGGGGAPPSRGRRTPGGG